MDLRMIRELYTSKMLDESCAFGRQTSLLYYFDDTLDFQVYEISIIHT